MTGVSNKKKIWFDLTMFCYFSQINSQTNDDVIVLGTYSVDADDISEPSTDAICDYILSHLDDFFVPRRYEKIEKIQHFRAVKTNALKFMYLHSNKTTKISSYIFISNIRQL